MDNFNLRKYLAEGRLLNEEEYIVTGKKGKGEAQYGEPYGTEKEARAAMEKILKSIKDIGEKPDAKFGVRKGPLEENEIGSLGKELADEIEDILDKDDKVNEVVDPVSILATILAGTTLTNILSKWVGKIFKKYNFGKGEEAAKKIESFTHRLEKDFKSPIKRVMGLFIKNEKALDVTTDALYAAVILTLGVLAGGGAVQALLKGDLNKGALQTLKAALKGKDLNTLIRDIATNIPG